MAVSVSTSGAVRELLLDRPEKLNALNSDVLRGLTDAFTALADEPAVRVVVLRGAGRAFSAGADLAAGSGSEDGGSTWAARRRGMGGWQRLLDLIERVPQVTVAAVHGHCIGGGALLAVTCDLRIVTTDARISIPELAIGIPLTWGGVPRLVREIGLPMARDLVMTGRTIDGSAAVASGFAQRLAPTDGLDAAVDELLKELTAMPDAPLAMTKEMFAAISRDRTGAAGWADADLLGWSFREPEGRQAAADYVARRLRKPGD